MTPEQLARQRTDAIALLEAELAGRLDTAQRQLWERLLTRLQDIHADPSLLPGLLAEYTVQVLAPLALAYAQGLLYLPALSVAYFAALDVTGYQQLRAPLTDFLLAQLGLDSTGALLPGGYLASVAADTTVAQQVLRYAYGAQASGTGLEAYRDGLKALVTGGDTVAEGVVGRLYARAADDYSRADRQLQTLAAQRLGLTAFLFQGGLIASSRPFCVVRDGRVFLDWEIGSFGTRGDAYGGYVRKQEGYFAGKPDPYTPAVDLGGYNCRHHLHALPNSVAIRMRPELGETAKGELFIK